MQRLLFVLAALVGFTMTALAQDQRPSKTSSTDSWTRQSAEMKRSQPLPPDPIPLRLLRGYDWFSQEAGDLGSLSDTLSEAQILRRLSRLYRFQSDILAAQADGDVEHAEGLLELAMTEIGTLTQQPDITERPRFRELYRTLVSEYERYYGVSDTALYLPHGGVYELRAEIFALLDEG